MRRRPGLVVRIYLIVLAQFAALALTFAVVRVAGVRENSAFFQGQMRFLVEDVTTDAPDLPSLEARLRDLKARTGIEVELRDRKGALVAASGRLRGFRPGMFEMDWRGGTARVASPPPSGPPFWAIGILLVVTAISAILMTAWLAKPLALLSAAARELGQGRLSTRANLRRNDELGDVATAFDEMAERIETLVRGQRELLANVSHELRTPIARIQVALDLASEGSAEDAAASLEGIAGDLAELGRLTNDILTSARLELSSSAAPLRIDDASANAQLDADPMLLRRALDNLLDNAAKYSDAGAPITLAANASGGRLAIEVRDRGSGISAEDMKSLFKPFFRADRSRSRQTGGLGLGLLVARRIVEAHQGTLRIESRLGEGTVARIEVPVAA